MSNILINSVIYLLALLFRRKKRIDSTSDRSNAPIRERKPRLSLFSSPMAGIGGKSGPPGNQNAFRHSLAEISQRLANGVLGRADVLLWGTLRLLVLRTLDRRGRAHRVGEPVIEQSLCRANRDTPYESATKNSGSLYAFGKTRSLCILLTRKNSKQVGFEEKENVFMSPIRTTVGARTPTG
jgi:hypothetical protein